MDATQYMLGYRFRYILHVWTIVSAVIDLVGISDWMGLQ